MRRIRKYLGKPIQFCPPAINMAVDEHYTYIPNYTGGYVDIPICLTREPVKEVK